MVLDMVIKQWCSENYDQTREKEYSKYAAYVVTAPWIKGLRRHRIFLWIVFALYFVKCLNDQPSFSFPSYISAAFQALGYVGVCVVVFVPYGFKKYNLQDGTTFVFYLMLFWVLSYLFDLLPGLLRGILTVAMLPVSFWLHHMIPHSFRRIEKEVKGFHKLLTEEEEQRKEQKARDEFDAWKFKREAGNVTYGGGFYEEVPEDTGYALEDPFPDEDDESGMFELPDDLEEY